MKVLHAGNMANLGYVISKQLRKEGIDVDLLLDPSGSDPTSFDPTLKDIFPNWLILYDRKKFDWKIKIIKKMRDNKYDLIHSYVELPIFAYLSGRTYLAQTMGSDFRELALTNSIRGFLLRKAYKKAKVILFSSPNHAPIFTKLGLENGIFLPFFWDSSFFKPQSFLENEYADKFLVFHPANLEWRLKGNDILVKGYADFVKANQNSLLIIIDRGIDSKRTHELVYSLGIENKVKFVNGPLNSTQLLRFYNLADVVADQFLMPGIGGIGKETLCCEKPLITYCPMNTFGEVYSEPPPVMSASNPTEVLQQLETLKDDRNRFEIGKKGRIWFTKHHDPHIYSLKIKSIYHSVLNNEKIDQIRENIKKITISSQTS